MTAAATMIDAVRVNAGNIPEVTPRVAGYVTGTGVVPWDDETWARFPNSVHVRIDQSPSLSAFKMLKAHIADVEPNAGTIGAFVDAVRYRIEHGAKWSTIYGTVSTIEAARFALHTGTDPHWYYGHVDCWLADWNLNIEQADAVIGTMIHGITCRAVQWASPTSNPDTTVPGSTLTLLEAQVDLSETATDFPLSIG